MKMDNSYIGEHCTNCALKFKSASEMFTKITVADESNCSRNFEIAILDAILCIYGFSATNLATAYLENGNENNNSIELNQVSDTSEYIIQHGLSLCSTCVYVFKEVYLAYRQLKRLSTKASLLTKAIKKFSPSPSWMKIEVVTEISQCKNTEQQEIVAKRNPKDVVGLQEAETLTVESSYVDLFQSFNSEADYEDDDNDQEDIKFDPLGGVEIEDDESILSSKLPTVALHDIKHDSSSRKLRSCRIKNSEPNITKTQKKDYKQAAKRDHPKESNRKQSSDFTGLRPNKTRRKRKKIIKTIGVRQRKEKNVKNHTTESEIADVVGSKLNRDSGSSGSFQPSASNKVESGDEYSNDGEGNEHHGKKKRKSNRSSKSKSLSTTPGDNEKLLGCSCGRFYSCLNTLYSHEHRCHKPPESLICDVCGELFRWNYLLYFHKSRKHSQMEEIILKCHLCDAIFSYPSSLKRHHEECHPTNPDSFICDKCGSSFKTLRRLRRHSLIHKDEGLNKEFKCTECNVVLKHEAGLQKHMRIMHRFPKTFSCPQCGKTTKNMTNMRIHMKVHDPNRTFKGKVPKGREDNKE